MYDAGAIVYTQYTTHNGNDGGTLFQLAILEFCQFLHWKEYDSTNRSSQDANDGHQYPPHHIDVPVGLCGCLWIL